MEFRILGPLEVHDGSGPVRVPGAKERALLANLLVHAGRVVAADRLVEDLWGEALPGNPANALQGRVSALRRALGPAGAGFLVTSPPGYVLAVEPEQLDAARFQRLVADAAAAREGPRAARLLEAALGLWRGPALAEFADRPWARTEAARLEELRLTAQEALVELRLASGGHAELVGELEALVAAHPLRERLRGQLMLALYRSGRQADALRVFGETRATLAEELGIDPSPELQRLQRAILTQDPAVGPPERARAPAAPPHNLPERLTSLIGRDRELDEVGRLVGQHRLVTVTGPGGVGKTSLAVEEARRLVEGFPDGVWLVELAALADPGLLAEAVAATLGLREEPGPPGTAPPAPADRLAGFVRDKILLMVLDNCEHLVAGCAELVVRLLRAAPGLRVLATSREVLGVPGELVRPVPPLAVPDPPPGPGPGDGRDGLGPEVLAGYDGVRLFLERAQLADPSFVLDRDNASAVSEICRRLDGLPLAIELAAARVRALPAAELAARLEGRFGLLAGAGRAQDPRQRTLRATVDWSFQLLEEPDRQLFRRLSVFAGGWTVAAAEAVCGGDGLAAAVTGDAGGVLEGLVRLVDRSLVVAVGGDPARFRMLETLRAYGTERLAEAGETELAAARHTAWFVDLAEEAAAHRTGRRWIRQLEGDYDNLRAAMDRAVAGGDHQTALRIGGALGWYWQEYHTEEGRQRLAGALALAEGQPPTIHLARTLLSSSMIELQRFPTSHEVAAARRSLDLFERFGDPVGAATAKILLALAELQHSGPSGDAVRLVAEAEAGFEIIHDRWGEAYAALNSLTVNSYHLGPPGQAEEVGRRALERFEALDDHWGRALALFALANLARRRGAVDAAVGRYEQAIAAARQDGPLWMLCASLIELGGLVAVKGDEERAVALHAESAAIARRAGWRRGIAYAWNGLGAIARARGDLERARQLHMEALGIVREVLGWSVPHTLAQLGCAEARLGDLDDAEAHLREAASLVLDAPQPVTAALVLVGHALVALGRGRTELAALLLAAAGAARDHAGAAPVGAERVEADLARQAILDRLGPDAYRSAEAAGRELGTEEALRLARGPVPDTLTKP